MQQQAINVPIDRKPTTLLIEGRSLDYAEKLKPIDIDKALNGLPEDHKHCAELSVRTLRRAINKYRDKI